MNRDKPYFVKRVIAYLIDFIIVTLLATVISMIFIRNDDYQVKTEQLMDLTRKYTTNEITREEYTKQFDEMNYYLTKDGVGTTVINFSVAIIYYVILCYLCHGITLGKYIMKLRIVGANNKELNVGNYFIRSLFVNMTLSNLISILFVYTMSKDTFVSIYPKVSSVLTLFLLATILFIMYRNDGRGLHDLIANTMIISTKDIPEEKENKDEIKEAEVIKEKKTTKKKSTKKDVK